MTQALRLCLKVRVCEGARQHARSTPPGTEASNGSVYKGAACTKHTAAPRPATAAFAKAQSSMLTHGEHRGQRRSVCKGAAYTEHTAEHRGQRQQRLSARQRAQAHGRAPRPAPQRLQRRGVHEAHGSTEASNGSVYKGTLPSRSAARIRTPRRQCRQRISCPRPFPEGAGRPIFRRPPGRRRNPSASASCEAHPRRRRS